MRDLATARELVRRAAARGSCCARPRSRTWSCASASRLPRGRSTWTATLALARTPARRRRAPPSCSCPRNTCSTALDGPYAEEAAHEPAERVRAPEGRRSSGRCPALTGGDYLIARVSRACTGTSGSAKNFVYQLWAALSEGREFRPPGDQIGTPTAVSRCGGRDPRPRAGRPSVAPSTSPAPSRMLRSDFASDRRRGARPRRSAGSGTVGRRTSWASRRQAAGAGLLIDRATAAARTPLLGPRGGHHADAGPGADRGQRLMRCRSWGSRGALLPRPRQHAAGEQLLEERAADSAEPSFPLEVGFCDHVHARAAHAHRAPGADFPRLRVRDSTSSSITEHFHALAAEAAPRFGLRTADDLVVEIGSNDGTLLRGFEPSGVRTLGIEPATNIADRPRERRRDHQRVLRARHRAPGA